MSEQKFVPNGALLLCEKGNKLQELETTSCGFDSNCQENWATAKDNKVGENFTSFGECAITKSPCCPVVTVWHDTATGITAGEHELLLESSFLPCQRGGIINIHLSLDFLLSQGGFLGNIKDLGGFTIGLFKGAVTSTVDFVTFLHKHSPAYIWTNPSGYIDQMKQDWNNIRSLIELSHNHSVFKMITDPVGFAAQINRDIKMANHLIDEFSNMSPEEAGELTGELLFDIVSGTKAAIRLTRYADDISQAIEALEKLEDTSDIAEYIEDLNELHDAVEESGEVTNVCVPLNGGINIDENVNNSGSW